ncbi:hypothetical protein [Variovorax sp. E3]|nr:hypothetical protein [Variovorax sp. E3]
MSRRKILLGTLGAAAVGAVGAYALRPDDHARPTTTTFARSTKS